MRRRYNGKGYGRGRMRHLHIRRIGQTFGTSNFTAAGPSLSSNDSPNNVHQTTHQGKGTQTNEPPRDFDAQYPPRPHVDQSLCMGCAMCLRVCPVGAITMDGPYAVIDSTTCAGCGICIRACPREAIRYDL